MFTLDNFEDEIDSDVLERGYDYYKSGNVRRLEQITETNWHAVVLGTEDYNVRIKINNLEIIESECSCPYDFGPYCKHEVAVMYTLRKKLNKSGENTKVKVNNLQDKIPLETFLEKVDKKTLIQIINDEAEENPELKAKLVAVFGKNSGILTKSHYKKIIREALKAGQDRHGFIDYWGAGRAMRSVYDLLFSAEDLVNKNKPVQAILIAQAAIEILVPVLNSADDSNGEIGGGIERVFGILNDASNIISENEKEELFTYCLQESQSKRYEGWSFHWEFLHIASSLISAENQQKELFNLLDKFADSDKTDFTSEYSAERAAEIKLKVLERLHFQKIVDQFINENLNLHNIRKIAIEQAIQKGNLEEAKRLCFDGIKLAENKWPGLISDYQQQLLKIAKKSNDSQSTVQLAEALFLCSDDFSYYDLLKSKIEPDKWLSFVENLARKIETQNVRASYFTLAEIYNKEGLINKLMQLIKKYNATHLLKEYELKLKDKFADEIADMYKKEVKEMLISTTGRGVYQEASDYLKRMKRLGKAEEVKELIK